jgi:hypothetical protein
LLETPGRACFDLNILVLASNGCVFITEKKFLLKKRDNSEAVKDKIYVAHTKACSRELLTTLTL